MPRAKPDTQGQTGNLSQKQPNYIRKPFMSTSLLQFFQPALNMRDWALPDIADSLS